MEKLIFTRIVYEQLGNCSNSNNEKRRANDDNVDTVFYSSLKSDRNHVAKPGIRLEIVIFVMLLLIWHNFHQVSGNS